MNNKNTIKLDLTGDKCIVLSSLPSLPEYRIVQEFTKAEYNLTPTELKLWLMILCAISEHQTVEGYTYAFNVSYIADKLQISKNQSRISLVRNLFKSLMKKQISIVDKSNQSNKKNSSTYDAPFISEAYYDANSRMIYISFVPTLHKILFSISKKINSVKIEINNLLQLKSIASMRFLIAVKELNDIGINCISLDEFRSIIQNYKYEHYCDFKKRVVKYIEQDIRNNTYYKDFTLTDNYTKGLKTTNILFSFVNEEKYLLEQNNLRAEMLDFFSGLKPHLLERLIEYQTNTLKLLHDAIIKGFSIEFLYKIISQYEEDVIAKNIESSLKYISESDINLTSNDCGRIIYASIKEDRAKAAKQQASIVIIHEENEKMKKAAISAAKRLLKQWDNRTYSSFVIEAIQKLSTNQQQAQELFTALMVTKKDLRKKEFLLLIKYMVEINNTTGIYVKNVKYKLDFAPKITAARLNKPHV